MNHTRRLRAVCLAAAWVGCALATLSQTAGPPSATQIFLTPNAGSAGQTLTVSVQGLTCRPDFLYAFQPPGISVKALPCAPSRDVPEPAALQLTISPQAKAGAYTLVVTRRGMPPVQVPGAFTVSPEAPPLGRTEGGAARIDRVSPQEVSPGGTYTLTLYGGAGAITPR